MNDMMQTGGAAGAVAALSNLRKGLQNVKQTLVVKGGDPYLRLLKHGEWVFGQEDANVDDDSIWAVNPMSIQHGFIAWPPEGEGAGAGPLGEVMVPATAPLPDRGELRDVGVEWRQQFSFQMRCVDGGDKGTQVLYKVSSVGGANAVDKILSAIIEQLDNDPTHPAPVVRLDMDSYPHKKWGKTFTPVFILVGWADMDGNYELDDEAPAPKPAQVEAAPARRTRRTKAEMEAARAAEQKAPELVQQAPKGEPSLEELEAIIAKRKAAAAQPPQEDPAAARRRELEAELAALEEATVAAVPASEPAPGQPIRRRRP